MPRLLLLWAPEVLGREITIAVVQENSATKKNKWRYIYPLPSKNITAKYKIDFVHKDSPHRVRLG